MCHTCPLGGQQQSSCFILNLFPADVAWFLLPSLLSGIKENSEGPKWYGAIAKAAAKVTLIYQAEYTADPWKREANCVLLC